MHQTVLKGLSMLLPTQQIWRETLVISSEVLLDGWDTSPERPEQPVPCSEFDRRYTPKIKRRITESDDQTIPDRGLSRRVPTTCLPCDAEEGWFISLCRGSSSGNKHSRLVGSFDRSVIWASVLVTAAPCSQNGGRGAGEANRRWLLYSLMKWFLAYLVLVTPIVLFIITVMQASHKY